ncbi:MAG TPA: DUF3667 domain-containing protein [Pyrinomonadaceae bacterium]|nr:DUF3667 domain-containing protein [Pyrinomonadaceae bacterium]
MSVEVKTAGAGEAEAEAVVAAADLCPECGGALAGDYCHRCGEKRPESRDLSVRHFFSEAAQELTSVEHSKVFHTLWALLFRPGFLTSEWRAGRRRRYLKPLNLCLALVALNFFAYSVYEPVSMFDIGKFVRESKREDTDKVFDRFAARKGTNREELFKRLGEKWARYTSAAAPLFVGGFALVLQAVFLLKRRYFVEHLVFAMHFASFSTLLVILLWPVYYLIGIKQGGVNAWVALFKWVLDIVYMFFAVRAVYGLGAGKSIPASIVLVVGYFLSYLLVFGGALIAAIVVTAFS